MNQNTNADSSSMFHNLTNAEKAIAEAWMTNLGPHFADLIQDAVLGALREHHKETGADKLLAEARMNMAKQAHAPKPTADEFVNITGNPDAGKWADLFIRTDPPFDLETMRAWFANAIMAGYDYRGKQIQDAETKQQDTIPTATELPGEREVWAQTYAAALQHKECIGYRPGVQAGMLAAVADEAVKAFRERYK